MASVASVSSIGTAAPLVGKQDASSAIEKATKQLGKDDFLKLLLTQLKYQDSQDPVKDKDFIAQMAQFSALEQTTNMTKALEKVAKRSQSNEALAMLGAIASAVRGKNGEEIKGTVTGIKFTDTDPEITITKPDGTIAVVNLTEVTGVGIA